MDNNKFKNINAIAIIPAKGNSTRLPKKNFQLIKSKTLIEHAIDYAKSSSYVKKIYVSTDADEIKAIAKKIMLRLGTDLKTYWEKQKLLISMLIY